MKQGRFGANSNLASAPSQPQARTPTIPNLHSLPIATLSPASNLSTSSIPSHSLRSPSYPVVGADCGERRTPVLNPSVACLLQPTAACCSLRPCGLSTAPTNMLTSSASSLCTRPESLSASYKSRASRLELLYSLSGRQTTRDLGQAQTFLGWTFVVIRT